MGFSEVLLIFVIALVVLGPQKLPKLVTQVGRWAGKARAMARQFREQLESEINLEELKSTQAKTPPPPFPESPAPAASPTEPWHAPAAEPVAESAPHAPPAEPAQAPAEPGSALADAGLGSATAASPEPPIVSEAFEHTIHAPPPPPETLSSTPIVETHERGT